MSEREEPDGSKPHYLREELYERVRNDDEIFEFLQKGSLDGIWYWDLENPRHEWMNEQFWRTFGYDPAKRAHLASEWQDMIDPDDLQLALKNFDEHAADPTVPYDQIVRYKHKDGHTTWVRCRGMIIRGADGTPARMLGAHTDVTALKEAEAELQVKNDKLESINRDLAELAYATSHDIKGPLRALGMLLDVVHEETEGTLSDEAAHTLELARRSALRMQGVVEGIISFATVTGAPPDATTFDANDLMRDIIEDLSSQIEETGASLEVENMPSSIVARRPVLRQLLMNLTANALKFRRLEGPEHRVIVSVQVKPNALEFAVTDNGIGIETKDQERIFEAFHRVHGQSIFEGTGLGLAICRRCVALHEGDIRVESKLGEGTTFHVTIPHP